MSITGSPIAFAASRSTHVFDAPVSIKTAPVIAKLHARKFHAGLDLGPWRLWRLGCHGRGRGTWFTRRIRLRRREHDHRHDLHGHDGYHDEQGNSSAGEKRLHAQAQLGEKLAS